jgi:hypothetical protein
MFYEQKPNPLRLKMIKLIDNAMRNQGCGVEQPHRMESLTEEEQVK